MQPKISGVILEQSVRFIRARRGVLSLAAGFFLGGGGLSGAALLAWNNQAALPPEEEEKISRRQRKAEAKLAAQEARGTAACSGLIQRWVRFPWWPHWQQVEAEVSHGLLLMRNTAEEKLMSRGSFATGARCVGVPLAGAKVAQVQDAPNAIDVTTAAGERESLRLQTREEHSLWTQALQGEKDRWMARRRVVEVRVPSSWEAPFEQPRLVSLDRHSAEYRRVEKLAKAQQFKPGPGQSPYVKGRIAVTGVSRVQQPHVWEQYCMRRAIIASENDGECEERELWHGTPVPHIITREGFDPRVCALSGMFGGGVYFADKSTKSVRYAGCAKPGDTGTLLLCRVSLGRPMLKWLPQPNMRRPPDPFPLFGLEHARMYAQGRKFHSVFANSDWALSPLIMNEYIVYHTNQAYAEYVVNFELI